MKKIENRIEKLELIYPAEVILKLRLQLEDAKNASWSRDELTEHLLSDDFGLQSDELNDIRDVQHDIINYFGEE